MSDYYQDAAKAAYKRVIGMIPDQGINVSAFLIILEVFMHRITKSINWVDLSPSTLYITNKIIIVLYIYQVDI